MVRRHGKRKMQDTSESGNGERKKEGVSSFARMATHVAREPVKRARSTQRDGLQEPGSFSLLFIF
jgi:hypothetical protein